MMKLIVGILITLSAATQPAATQPWDADSSAAAMHELRPLVESILRDEGMAMPPRVEIFVLKDSKKLYVRCLLVDSLPDGRRFSEFQSFGSYKNSGPGGFFSTLPNGLFRIASVAIDSNVDGSLRIECPGLQLMTLKSRYADASEAKDFVLDRKSTMPGHGTDIAIVAALVNWAQESGQLDIPVFVAPMPMYRYYPEDDTANGPMELELLADLDKWDQLPAKYLLEMPIIDAHGRMVFSREMLDSMVR